LRASCASRRMKASTASIAFCTRVMVNWLWSAVRRPHFYSPPRREL
jgi:hypothetical protein